MMHSAMIDRAELWVQRKSTLSGWVIFFLPYWYRAFSPS